MRKTVKVPVTERALFARVARAIAKDGKSLRKCRYNTGCYSNLGRYYIVEDARKLVIDFRIDLVTYAKNMGLLASYEELQS